MTESIDKAFRRLAPRMHVLSSWKTASPTIIQAIELIVGPDKEAAQMARKTLLTGTLAIEKSYCRLFNGAIFPAHVIVNHKLRRFIFTKVRARVVYSSALLDLFVQTWCCEFHSTSPLTDLVSNTGSVYIAYRAFAAVDVIRSRYTAPCEHIVRDVLEDLAASKTLYIADKSAAADAVATIIRSANIATMSVAHGFCDISNVTRLIHYNGEPLAIDPLEFAAHHEAHITKLRTSRFTDAKHYTITARDSLLLCLILDTHYGIQISTLAEIPAVCPPRPL